VNLSSANRHIAHSIGTPEVALQTIISTMEDWNLDWLVALDWWLSQSTRNSLSSETASDTVQRSFSWWRLATYCLRRLILISDGKACRARAKPI
jgi:hypothetical protein